MRRGSCGVLVWVLLVGANLCRAQSLGSPPLSPMSAVSVHDQLRLREFRAYVESHSYGRALRLCEGFKVLEQGRIREAGRLAPALAEWTRIAFFGFWDNVDSVSDLTTAPLGLRDSGLKGVYLDVRDRGFADWNRMFTGSLYSLYFVESVGFSVAARNCLGNDPDRVRLFALSLAFADSAGLVAGGAVTGAVLMGSITALLRSLRAGARGVAHATSLLAQRFPGIDRLLRGAGSALDVVRAVFTHKYTVRTAAGLAGVGAVYVSLDLIPQVLAAADEQEADARELGEIAGLRGRGLLSTERRQEVDGDLSAAAREYRRLLVDAGNEPAAVGVRFVEWLQEQGWDYRSLARRRVELENWIANNELQLNVLQGQAPAGGRWARPQAVRPGRTSDGSAWLRLTALQNYFPAQEWARAVQHVRQENVIASRRLGPNPLTEAPCSSFTTTLCP